MKSRRFTQHFTAATVRCNMIPEQLFGREFLHGPWGRIAHALGGIAGHSHTNSLEALEASNAAGYKLFEVDLVLTQFDEVVCYHELSAPPISLPRDWPHVDRDEFLNSRYSDNLTPLDLATLVDRLQHIRDAFLIVDTKDCNAAILPRLIDTTCSQSEKLLSCIIPEVYSEADLLAVKDMDVFERIIFSCYLCDYDQNRIAEMAGISGVVMVAMYPERLSDRLRTRLQKSQCGVFVHTINDAKRIRAFLAAGVGVYTDDCPPEEVLSS